MLGYQGPPCTFREPKSLGLYVPQRQPFINDPNSCPQSSPSGLSHAQCETLVDIFLLLCLLLFLVPPFSFLCSFFLRTLVNKSLSHNSLAQDYFKSNPSQDITFSQLYLCLLTFQSLISRSCDPKSTSFCTTKKRSSFPVFSHQRLLLDAHGGFLLSRFGK